MSAMMIATTALLIASATSHGSSGSGGDCPISSYGATCLIVFCAMLLAGTAALIAAMTRDIFSKWSDRWFFTAIVLWVLSVVPITVGMIHDCQ